MSITYRTATVADAALLADLGARTFTATFGHLYSSANLAIFLDNHTQERWAAALAGDATVRLAEVNGVAIGYARIGPLTFAVERGGRTAAQLYQLYVDAPWHGSGIAATLLDWSATTAREQGAADLWLSVFVDNPRARRFYARAGFVEVMPYTFMVGDHADEDIICRLALDVRTEAAA
ncbi:GNAT family N-acetyltransferase [Polymorphobacter sp. PAMC 29334]|uniref:GNAT family N-acetyltransferase n=1 Tax=Polymorphobacter sp. PAMC 29334 TaxID=2862331 RepID=UPI001C6784A4|nr:GNAT family N-acetyltransferase [Polymorphobacter sp. PAMC 29334]QYE35996.1 GNAT family N-acetyltransferase [Polymorphobacter sp. PAMC 29334]